MISGPKSVPESRSIWFRFRLALSRRASLERDGKRFRVNRIVDFITLDLSAALLGTSLAATLGYTFLIKEWDAVVLWIVLLLVLLIARVLAVLATPLVEVKNGSAEGNDTD
jgi:hypothetical protein